MNRLRQLEVFRAVAEAGSFTGAAELLFVSQPVVSRTVRELERSLDTTLFQRTTRSTTLTAEGRELLRLTVDLTRRFDDTFRRFDLYRQGVRGHVIVAALPSIAAGVLPGTLRRLTDTHPDVTIDILDAVDAVEHLLAGHASIAIATPPADASDLEVIPLLRDDFVAVMARDHPLAGRNEVSWAELVAYPYITISGSSVDRLSAIAMAEAEVRPDKVTHVRTIATAGALVEAGLGVTALPQLALPLTPTPMPCTRALTAPTLGRDIALMIPTQTPRAPAVEPVIAAVTEHMRSQVGPRGRQD